MIQTAAAVRHYARTIIIAMCALFVVSCSDKDATGPIVPEQPPIAGAALLTCTVTTEGVARMECRPSVGQVFAMPGKSLVPAGVNASLLSAVGGTIILGGQGTNVQLTSSNIVATATQVTGNVTVQNLIGQPLGTVDGTTLAPEGVRVFFSSGPNANTGTVTVGNANGTAFFTASDQPYHQYNEILSTNEVSPSKQWVFNLAGGATTFTFGVYVWAPVQYPDGWIDVTPSSDALDLNTGDVTQQLTGTVKNQLGATVVETITWGTSDSEVATVDAAGLVTAHEAGTTTITATAGTKTGSSSITVTGPSLTNSTVTSQFNEIARDGAATSVITVQLKDGANANVTIGGRTVVIATDKGTISATTDNGNGTYTATLTSSTTIETATITATVDDDAITDNASVNFISTALAAADTYSETVLGNVSVNSANVTPTAFNVLTNDATEFDTQVTGAGWLATPNKTENGGDVTITAAGTFIYNPPAGFEGTDRFTYTITGGTTANVTLTVSGMLWFVDASAASCASVANGCGRLSNPFNSLANFNTANNGAGNNPGAGDGIFIFENASSYTGPLNLLATQKVIGQDATASLATLGYATPTSSTALPAMNSGNGVFVTIAGTDGINLNANNTLRGFTIANTAGQGIEGVSFGTLTLGGDVAINASAQALALTTGTIAGDFAGVTSTGGTLNVGLTTVTGTSNFGTGALSGTTTGIALQVTGGIALTYGGSITSSSAGVGVRVAGTATVTLTGNFSYSGSNNALLVDNHTGTLNMSGQFNATAGNGAFFTNADGTYTFNVAAGSGITGGSNGVTITTDTDGTFTFGANFDISGTTGAAFQTIGAVAADLSPTVTFNGDLTHNGTATLTNLGRLTAGANLTFAGSLSTTSGTGFGIVVNTSDGGTVTFSGASKVIQTGANAAVSIVTAGPTVNFTNGGLALTTTNGAIFVSAAATLNISGNNNTIVNGTGSAVNVTNATFSVANGTGNTITSTGRAFNLGTVTIGAAGLNYNSVSASPAAGTAAITLSNVDATNPIVIGGGTLTAAAVGGTVNLSSVTGSFSYAGAVAGSGTGQAIGVSAGSVAATFSGPVSYSGSVALLEVLNHTGSVTLNNTVTATSGTGLQFVNADGTYNISPSAATTFGATDAGVDIISGSEGTFTFGANLSINNPSGTAFRVNSSTPAVAWNGNITKTNGGLAVDITTQAASARTITFQNGTIAANTNTTGIQLSDVDGTVSFNGTATLSGSDAGIDVIGGSTGTITFAATTSITNPSGPAVFVDASAPTLTIPGSISTNAARPVHIEDLTGGSVTISASINTTGQGILVQNNTTGSVIVNFTSGTKTLNTGANPAVQLINNDGGTVNFTNGGLVITTTSGTAFSATDGGTVNVTTGVTNNTVSTSSGIGVNIQNTNIGANNVTFTSIAKAGGSAYGIRLENTGTSGGLKVPGTGGANSGGTIAMSSLTAADSGAITLTNTANLSLEYIRIEVTTGAGAGGIASTNLQGTNLIRNSVFDYNGTTPDAVPIHNAYAMYFNQTNTNATITLDGTSVNGTRAGASAGVLSARGTSNVTFNIIDSNTLDGFQSLFTDLFGSGWVISSGDGGASTAVVNLTLRDSRFTNAAPNGTNNFEMGVLSNATMNYKIKDNVFQNVANATCVCGIINVNTQDAGVFGSNVAMDSIVGNTVTNTGTGSAVTARGYLPVRIAFDNSSAVTNRVVLANNTITDSWQVGVLLSTRQNSIGHFKVINNTIGTAALPVGQANFRGISTDLQANSTMNVEITGNNVYGAGTVDAAAAIGIRVGTDPGSATMNATVLNNTIRSTHAGTNGRFRAESGTTGTGTMCIDLRSNNLEDNTKFYTVTHTGGTMRVEGAGGGVVSNAAIAAANPPGAGNVSGTVLFNNGANCTQPPI